MFDFEKLIAYQKARDVNNLELRNGKWGNFWEKQKEADERIGLEKVSIS